MIQHILEILKKGGIENREREQEGEDGGIRSISCRGWKLQMRKLRLRKKREHQKHDSGSGLSEFKGTMLRNPMPLELTSNNYPELGFSSLGSKENYEKVLAPFVNFPPKQLLKIRMWIREELGQNWGFPGSSAGKEPA